MRWPIYAIFVYLALALEGGLSAALAIDRVSPSFLLPLMVFIALCARPSVALWAALIMGVLADATQTFQAPERVLDLAVLGPVALGYLGAAGLVLKLREIVFRQSTLTMAALVFLAGLVVHLIAVGLLSLRVMPWTPGERLAGWDAADQLTYRFLALLYTSVITVPLGMVLLRTEKLWGFTFPPHGARR